MCVKERPSISSVLFAFPRSISVLDTEHTGFSDLLRGPNEYFYRRSNRAQDGSSTASSMNIVSMARKNSNRWRNAITSHVAKYKSDHSLITDFLDSFILATDPFHQASLSSMLVLLTLISFSFPLLTLTPIRSPLK